MAEDYIPPRREIFQYIRNQGKLLVVTATVLALLLAALVRKGVITWGDLVRLEGVTSG